MGGWGGRGAGRVVKGKAGQLSGRVHLCSLCGLNFQLRFEVVTRVSAPLKATALPQCWCRRSSWTSLLCPRRLRARTCQLQCLKMTKQKKKKKKFLHPRERAQTQYVSANVMRNRASCFKRGPGKRSGSAEQGRAAIRWELRLHCGGQGVKERVGLAACDFRKGPFQTEGL